MPGSMHAERAEHAGRAKRAKHAVLAHNACMRSEGRGGVMEGCGYVSVRGSMHAERAEHAEHACGARGGGE